MSDWIEACEAGDIDEEDVMRFDHGGRTFAIYRSPDDEYFATDGLCTHGNAHLADGVQRALGREPKDFADYARATAATGIWGGQGQT